MTASEVRPSVAFETQQRVGEFGRMLHVTGVSGVSPISDATKVY